MKKHMYGQLKHRNSLFTSSKWSRLHTHGHINIVWEQILKIRQCGVRDGGSWDSVLNGPSKITKSGIIDLKHLLHVKYWLITLIRVCFPGSVFSSRETGGTGGGASRSSRMSTCWFRLTARLCRMQHANIICAPFSGEYCSTPPDRSRQRKRLFRDPKVRSITECAVLCAVL